MQPVMKDTLTEIKNKLQGNKSKVDGAKNQINDLEYKGAKTKNKKTNQNNKKKKSKNNEDSQAASGTASGGPICIIGVPEGEEKEQEIRNLLEKIMKENFTLVKEIDIQVQEAQSPKQDGCKESHSKIHHN